MFSCELYKIFQDSLFVEHFVSVTGHKNYLTIISVDFLEGPFEVRVKGGNYVPCLKLIRIMLEIWYIGTHPYTVLENITFSTKTLLILLIPAFFVKNWAFFCKTSTFSQSNSVGAVLDIFSSVFSFCKIKGYVNENITFTGYAFGIQLSDCSELAINRKNDNDVPVFRYDVIVNFFWRCFVSLVKLSYWSKFHINIITGSGVMAIYSYKGLTRNPEIGNIPVWVLHSFYCFWFIKGKPTGGTPSLPD